MAKNSKQSLTINSTLRINTGYEIPVLGFGVYQTPAAKCEEVVIHAFKTGYRHVDSAAAYRNEHPAASPFRAPPTSTTSAPTPTPFFTTKIPPGAVSYTRTKKQILTSLATTSLPSLSLVLIHAPYGGSANRKGAWRALVEAQEAGQVQNIGVSNYGLHHLRELETHIQELEQERGGKGRGGRVNVGQWEIHPWLPRPDIVEWCRAHDVVIEAYSPLVRGERMQDPLLAPLVRKHGKTPAQILIRWSLQKGYVPLPKSETLSRIEENADVFDFELDEADMKSLETDEYSPCTWDPTVSTLED